MKELLKTIPSRINLWYQNTSLTKHDDLKIRADFEISHLEYVTKFPLKDEYCSFW